ncbi:NFYB/HAP3 family transcription factor subunit [Candidatus Woesearchaeota archaeon]|nr:NFYB/HAP3 family transcription factor subunit [Candidatus Woesearchaeota archaeon]
MPRPRKTILPKANIARLMEQPNMRISDNAAKAMLAHLEEYGTNIAKRAIRYSQHAGRKTVTADDVKLAEKG